MDHAPQGLTLAEIEPGAAALALAGLEGLDPRGMTGPGDIEAMARRGRCFRIEGQAASAVYVLTVRNGVAWVDALHGAGSLDVVALVDEVLTHQAAGLDAIALQTRRPGLVKKLQRRGYRVSGWVMRKELRS